MTYVWYKTANNVVSFLTSAISSSSTNMIVNDWWIFPTSFPYLLTIEQRTNWQTTVREIVKATAKTWNTITIERAVESCILDDSANPKSFSQVAHSFEANSIVSLSMTAWIMQDCQAWITDNTNAIANANDLLDTMWNLIDQIEQDLWNL